MVLVRVLGSLEVVDDGHPVAVSGRSQRRLLALLVSSSPDALSIEHLADALGQTESGVRNAMSRLRKVIDRELLPSVGTGYAYVGHSDQREFEAVLAHSPGASAGERVSQFRRGLELWRGDGYGEFGDQPWARAASARLHELRDGMRESLAEALIEQGACADAAAQMRALLGSSPYRDRACGLLMRALAADGRQTEALRQYHDYRQGLVDDVGVEVGDELQELEARIAQGWHDPIASRPAGSSADPTGPPLPDGGGNLKSQVTPIIGRKAELGDLLSAMEQHRLVTLIGVGGVGKTRLALEAAQAAPQPPEGTWFVELGLVSAEGDVGLAVADALGIRTTPGLSASDSVVEWCGSRELLIVLDNCEHVVRAASRLAQSLVTQTPGVRVLATSREPLMAAGERVFPVPTLALPDEPEGDNGAVDLFVDRARSELLSFVADDHLDAIHEICRRLDGIPLALELAAARVRGLSPERIASRLDERFRLLTGGRRTAVERQATLRATVDWSYDLLDQRDRALFEQLSVFAGPFSLDDVVALIGGDELDTIDGIAHLVDRSLVARGANAPEYHLLETMRAYGREHLDQSDAMGSVMRRHAEVMATKAARALPGASGPDERSIVLGIRAQMADYAGAVTWATENGEPRLAVDIARDLFLMMGLWGENASPGMWMCNLVEKLDTDEPWTADALAIAGNWHLFFGTDVERAQELHARALRTDPTSSLVLFAATFLALTLGTVEDASAWGLMAQRQARSAAEMVYASIGAGHSLLGSGDLAGATSSAAEFVQWAEERQSPSALGMARQLEGRVLAETDPARALEVLSAARHALEAEVPECWIPRVNVLREMIPLTHELRPEEAVQTAVAALQPCARHNEVGNARSTLAYAAILLAAGRHDEVAAKAVGAAGDGFLGRRVSADYVEAKRTLEERLGDEYGSLVARGAGAALETTNEVIAALESIL